MHTFLVVLAIVGIVCLIAIVVLLGIIALAMPVHSRNEH